MTNTDNASGAGMEPDWRELTRRLYVELFHCNRQMTTERRKWTAGPCVLNALKDAKDALEAFPTSADRDAYEGAREDLLDWKRRALKAEDELRKECETTAQLTRALANEVNGPTFMGEPSLRTDASRLLAEKEGELKRMRQGLWDVYAALGCDTDGDPTPIALVSDIVELVVSAAKEARQDYDAALKP